MSKAGAPQVLHITHAANGTVIVESQVNESHARVFKAGSKTMTPQWPTGTISMTSRWDGRSLVSHGRYEASGAAIALEEVLAPSADGRTLTITITSGTESAGKSVSTFVYARTRSVGSCKTWPTPCKV